MPFRIIHLESKIEHIWFVVTKEKVVYISSRGLIVVFVATRVKLLSPDAI